MSEGRSICGGGSSKDTVAIDTNRILDSCRDKDCYEDVRVYLSSSGQEIIERTGAIRVKSADIVWTYVGVEPVQFSRGFYTVSIRFYVRVICEACVCAGKSQEVYGLAVIEKKVILFGSEGNVSIYRSNGQNDFCARPVSGRPAENNLPVGVVEVASPVVLDVRVVEPQHKCCCCCCVDDVPEEVVSLIGERFADDDDDRRLVISLGFFSVVRIERPAQYLITAAEYCIPRKECVAAEEDDPCSLFRNMAFPTAEFCPPSLSDLDGNNGGCGCRGKCGG